MSEKIKAALAQLDPSNDNHWTADGMPRIETMRVLTGLAQLTRDQVIEADPSYTRAARLAPPAPPAPVEKPPEPVLASPEPPPAAPVVKDLEQRHREETIKLDEMRAYKQKVDIAVQDQQQRVDKLRTEIDALAPPAHKVTMSVIQEYQASQNKAREARGEKWATFKSTGLKLTDILPLRAPIDQARMRKTGR